MKKYITPTQLFGPDDVPFFLLLRTLNLVKRLFGRSAGHALFILPDGWIQYVILKDDVLGPDLLML